MVNIERKTCGYLESRWNRLTFKLTHLCWILFFPFIISAQSVDYFLDILNTFYDENGEPIGPEPPSYLAYAISGNGSVVVGERITETGSPGSGQFERVGFKWEAGELTLLPMMDRALWASDNGEVILGELGGFPGSFGKPFMRSFDSVPVRVEGDKVAQASQGQTITLGDSGLQATLGADGRWNTPSQSFEEGSMFAVTDVSGDGTTFVGFRGDRNKFSPDLPETLRAHIWREDETIVIPFPRGPWDYSWATGVSYDGKTVIGQVEVANPNDALEIEGRYSSFIWTEEGGTKLIYDLAVELVPFYDWTDDLDFAVGISENGRIIAGMGVEPFLFEIEQPTEIIVNSTADRPRRENADTCETGEFVENGDPECTLRSAIEAVNAGVGKSILFDIEGAGIHEIVPNSPLPALTESVRIDGFSDPESDFVWIRGSGAGSAANGISVQGASAAIRGLIVTEFEGSGIHIDGGSGHSVEQCILGTDTEGTEGLGNGTGLTVVNAEGVTIGTNEEAPQPLSDTQDLPEKQSFSTAINVGAGNLLNVISGNINGVFLKDSSNVSMNWNLLGTKPNGIEALANLQAAVKAQNLNLFNFGNEDRPTPLVGSLLAGEFENLFNSTFTNLHLNMDTEGGNPFAMIPKGLLFKNSKKTLFKGLLAANIMEAGLEFEGGEDFELNNFKLGTNITGTGSFPLGTGIKMNSFKGARLGTVLDQLNMINAKTGLFLKNLTGLLGDLPSQQSDTGVSPRMHVFNNSISRILFNLNLPGEELLGTMDNGICLFDSSDIDIDDVTMGSVTDKAFQLDGIENLKVLQAKIGTNLLGTKIFPVRFGFHAMNSKGIGFGSSERPSLINADFGMLMKNLKTLISPQTIPSSNTRSGFATRMIVVGNTVNNLLINLGLDGETSLGETTETGICIENSCDFDMDNISMGRMTNGFLVSNSESFRLKRMTLGTNRFGRKIFPMGFGFHGTNIKGFSFGDPDRKSFIMARTGFFMKNWKARLAEGDNLSPQNGFAPRLGVNIGSNKILNMFLNLSEDGEESVSDDAETGICLQETCDVEIDKIFMGRMQKGMLMNLSERVRVPRMMLGLGLLSNRGFNMDTGIEATNCKGLSFGDNTTLSAINAKTGFLWKNVKAYKGTNSFPNSIQRGNSTRNINIGNGIKNMLFNLFPGSNQPVGTMTTAACLDDSCEVEISQVNVGPTTGNVFEVLQSSLIKLKDSTIGQSSDGENTFPIGGFSVFINDMSSSVELIDNTFVGSEMGAVKVDGFIPDILIRRNQMLDNLQSIIREFNSTSQLILDAFGGSTVFQGTILGEPGDTIIMDFYSQGPDQSASAAEVYLGEQVVQLDENGMGEYTAVFKDTTPDDWKVTTTVTDSILGTSPLAPSVSLTEAPDTDMDGMPDYWEELFHCLDPNDPDDAEEDCDVDGASNLEEYENGRVPTLDERQIGIGQFDIGDVNSLTFGALDNFEYILECSLTLQPDSWIEVDRVVVEDEGEVTLSDPSPPAASKFYRITGRSL